MAGQFAGKVAVVTGAGSGIGRASALALAREGARVVVADRAAGDGEETARQIATAGGEALFAHVDVTDADGVEALIARTVATYGRLDYAHNNAGIEGAWGTSLHEYPLEVWERVFAINVTGVWLCMKAEISQMLAQGHGVIVNTASVAGLAGAPGACAYGASKHAVLGLTKGAALEYAQRGIRVNAICPTWTRTPLVERILAAGTGPIEQMEAGVAAYQPMGRMATVEEVAAAVVWLCSDAASFTTGHALPIDGGARAR
jgi:NAD(P)-dependent dehydrogenase (short-subunit alcohol dehydrogenase family)